MELRHRAVTQDFVHHGYGRVQKVAPTERSELPIQIRVKADRPTTSNNLFATRKDQLQIKVQGCERLL
ncbi:hypothetical protein AUI06_02645 [archaeon 13_2_20CM_2_52_21]|nr:MAG: hypothetical protein AUI06_02645 [archaeon 13_2_20CM_2_52_21]